MENHKKAYAEKYADNKYRKAKFSFNDNHPNFDKFGAKYEENMT